jgi:nicotinamide mononucleotide transporter
VDWAYAYHEFQLWWAACSWLEVIGCVAGLACVWLYGKENIWAWPVGIVNAGCLLVVVYDAKLYSDVVLQIVFLVLTFTGWYEWLHGGPQKTERKIVVQLPGTQRAAMLAITFAINLAAAWYFAIHTDAASFFWDASILAFSLLAQWLLNKKVLGTWLFWIAVNVLSVYVYAGRKLYLMAVLYVIFFFLAIKGYLEWKRILRAAAAEPKQESAPELAAVPSAQ